MVCPEWEWYVRSGADMSGVWDVGRGSYVWSGLVCPEWGAMFGVGCYVRSGGGLSGVWLVCPEWGGVSGVGWYVRSGGDMSGVGWFVWSVGSMPL